MEKKSERRHIESIPNHGNYVLNRRANDSCPAAHIEPLHLFYPIFDVASLLGLNLLLNVCFMCTVSINLELFLLMIIFEFAYQRCLRKLQGLVELKPVTLRIVLQNTRAFTVSAAWTILTHFSRN